MLLTIVTIVAILMLIGLPLFGLQRGSAVVFFVGLLVILSGLSADAIGVSAAQRAEHPMVTRGVVTLWVFIPLFLASFPLGAYMSRFYPMNFDPFDFLFSFTFGLVVAFMGLHFFLRPLVYSVEGKPEHAALQKTFIVRQVVYRDGWNRLVKSVTMVHEKTAGPDAGRVKMPD